MGGAPFTLAEQGCVCSFKCSAFNPERAPTLFTYIVASVDVSKPSHYIYIAGATSNITAHHVLFTAIKRFHVEDLCIFVFTGKANTIDMDIQTF